MSDAALALPPDAARLDELNPYAVEARYGLVEPGALDRVAASRMIDAIDAWAEEQLSCPPAEPGIQ